MIVGGWFDFALIQSGLLFGFQYGKTFPAIRLNVTSRKSVSIRFVSIAMFRPSFLNRDIMFFLVMSSTGPLQLFIAARQSSL